MEEKQLTLLREQVQYNCHVADARHGGDYGLCTYLLRMREYYRWECGLGFAEVPPRERVAEWIERREALWDGLDAAEFAPLTLAGKRFGPFDSAAINHHLVPGGLVYSGGLGSAGKPHFFLGRLERQEVVGGHTLFVSGRELARDLAAPPAMTLEGDIFVRRESLRRMLWEKLESWRWQRPDNALGRAFSSYAFDSDTEAALDAMCGE
ncbi:MAG: Sfum_1244 family protein [Candidatus Sedimenticola endophacoides]